MTEEKNALAQPVADEKAAKPPKVWQYAGPKPAPLISNLPIDLKQPRLGTLHDKYSADELPEKYVEYVRRTAPHTKDWWK